MPVSGCSGAGLAGLALAAVLLLPTPPSPPVAPAPPPRRPLCPPADLLLAAALLLAGLLAHFAEWIHRKVMERRILKLNQYLAASLERLRAWDSQQEQAEATLKMVHNATTEYNLLLYLLLRRHLAPKGLPENAVPAPGL